VAKSVNKVILLGNLGKDPESKNSAGGTLRTMVSIATTERVKKGDKWEDTTEWHSVVMFGRLAEIARDYLRKGSKVFIEGRLKTHKWEGDDQQTHWRTDIIATEISLIDGNRGDARPPAAPEDSYESESPF
jgi:single-strand DNA-binding protein